MFSKLHGQCTDQGAHAQSKLDSGNTDQGANAPNEKETASSNTSTSLEGCVTMKRTHSITDQDEI
jgi:hypothetical protein